MKNLPTPTPLSYAHRTDPFQELIIREMTRLGDEAGAVNLSQGLPDFDSPPEILEAAVDAIRQGLNQYTFPFGLTEFREAIAQKTQRYNHITADPATDITVTCGVSEAVMSAVLALSDPGDEVVILEPWYENYVPACQMTGAIPRFVPMRPKNANSPHSGLVVDPDELRKAFNNHTRLVMVNTPQNPTGHVFSRDELQAIASLCQQYGAVAVTDEIYEYILYDGHEHISIGSLAGMEDRTVTISGLGKTYALTGWRIGWAVAHEQLSALIRKVHDYLTICAPAPFQAAGVTALKEPEAFYTAMRAEYDARRRFLLGALEQAGLPYVTPEGAYYVMAYFDGVKWDSGKYARPEWDLSRRFAEYMAREVGVAVVPGSSFYAERAGVNPDDVHWVRINFARRAQTLAEAGLRLRKLSQG